MIGATLEARVGLGNVQGVMLVNNGSTCSTASLSSNRSSGSNGSIFNIGSKFKLFVCLKQLAFIETVKDDFGVKAMHRDVIEADQSYALREPAELYAGNFSGPKLGKQCPVG